MVHINGQPWVNDIEGLARMVSTYGRGHGETVAWDLARRARSSITQAEINQLLSTLTEVALCDVAPDPVRRAAADARDALARARGREPVATITNS